MEAPATALNRGAALTLAPWRALLGFVLLTAAALTLALAAILLVRSWSGLHEPLEPLRLAAVGLLLSGIVLTWHCAFELVRPAWASDLRSGAAPNFTRLHLAADLAAVALALALTTPGASALGIVLLWLPLVIAEAGWWSALRLTTARSRIAPGLAARESLEREVFERAITEPDHESDPELLEAELEENVVQRIVRVREQGVEWFVGQYRCDFAPSERTQAVHVVFCPPCTRAPELSIMQLDGPAATIKATPAQPYGARLEVRLARASREATSVMVEVRAPMA